MELAQKMINVAGQRGLRSLEVKKLLDLCHQSDDSEDLDQELNAGK